MVSLWYLLFCIFLNFYWIYFCNISFVSTLKHAEGQVEMYIFWKKRIWNILFPHFSVAKLEVVRELVAENVDSDKRLEALTYSAIYLKVLLLIDFLDSRLGSSCPYQMILLYVVDKHRSDSLLRRWGSSPTKQTRRDFPANIPRPWKNLQQERHFTSGQFLLILKSIMLDHLLSSSDSGSIANVLVYLLKCRNFSLSARFILAYHHSRQSSPHPCPSRGFEILLTGTISLTTLRLLSMSNFILSIHSLVKLVRVVNMIFSTFPARNQTYDTKQAS